MPATTSRAAPGSPAHGRGRVAAELAVGLVPLLLAAATTARRLDLPRDYVLTAVAAYGLFAAAVQGLLPPQPWPGLGPANRVTVGRAALVLSLAALVPHAQALSSAGLWWIIGMAIAALCLDGVDGLVARRTGTGTAFGARFDMELDSFLMLVLAALVWRSGRLDAWILLLGAPRYVFVATSRLLPWLRAPLPQRLRRKAGCVAQGVALVVCLAPVVPAGLAAASAALTLVLLVGSFAVDVRWLFDRRREGTGSHRGA